MSKKFNLASFIRSLTASYVQPARRRTRRLFVEQFEQRLNLSGLSFSPAVNYPAGDVAYSVAVADFDGDQALDFAVANAGSNTVSILMGNGNGTFQAAVPYAVFSSPRSVAVGDFNGDGNRDLVTNGESFSLSILLGAGDGTFVRQPAGSAAAGVIQRSVAVGDFNGDGNDDLAASYSDASDVRILLGNGDGTFQLAHINAVPGAQAVAVEDFNNDNKLDLVTANIGSASVLLGDGNGAFALAFNYDLPAGPAGPQIPDNLEPRDVEVGDFNADGNTDIAVPHRYGTVVSIFLGNGDGSFGDDTSGSPLNYPAGAEPTSVEAGDFDGDGKTDLAATNDYTHMVSILLGNGTNSNTFQAPISFGVGTNPNSVRAGDFNADGKLDLAIANSSSANVSILLNNTAPPTAQEQIVAIDNQVNGLVTTSVLSSGNGNALLTKLNAATNSLNGGNKNAGINQLKAFINQVNAFKKSGKLTNAQAQSLIDDANHAIASAGV